MAPHRNVPLRSAQPSCATIVVQPWMNLTNSRQSRGLLPALLVGGRNMFPRKYLPLLLMMLPFISGFSDHWLRAEMPWKKWPLQPKVAFSADVISRTAFGSSKGRIYFSPPGQLRVDDFDDLSPTWLVV